MMPSLKQFTDLLHSFELTVQRGQWKNKLDVLQIDISHELTMQIEQFNCLHM